MNSLSQLMGGAPRGSSFVAPPDLRTALEGVADFRVACSGEPIMRAGDRAAGVFLIRQGSVRASLPAENGRDLVTRILGEGSLLGVPAAMCSNVYQFNVEAVQDVEVGYIDIGKLNDFLRTRTDLCMQVVSMMCDELTALRQTHDHMATCKNSDCSLHESCTHFGNRC